MKYLNLNKALAAWQDIQPLSEKRQGQTKPPFYRGLQL